MKDIISEDFYGQLHNKKEQFPWNGQIEITYRCNLDCIHCYCKGSEDRDQKTEDRSQNMSHDSCRTQHASGFAPKTENRELTTQEWKKILDEIHKEGCLWLTFTGGDPLMREDFLEIYSYAKTKGFIITLFTNGQAFTDEIIDYLVKFPPHSIEITLNGITKDTYEAITQVEGSFSKAMNTIKLLAKTKLSLILKTNCLKQNKHEVGKIKAFTERLLGKSSKNKYFKYAPMISPRLNGDKTPCDYRLSFEELVKLRKEDADIWQEYEKGLHSNFPNLERNRNFLYHCNSWMKRFFISSYGWLKFCMFSDKFSIDLKTTSFKQGFYKIFPQLLKERFKTDSKCKDCPLRPICYYCPARAYLETGDEEAPVPYYCELAKETAKQMHAKLPNC